MSALMAVAVGVLAASTPEHRLHLSFGGGAQAYLSDTRTMGGVGGGVGVRDIWRDFVLLEADVSYLVMVGNVFAFRAGGGVQWPGVYSPSITFDMGLMVGDRFAFIQPGQSISTGTPTMTFGVVVSPLRFWTSHAIVSVLQLGAGLGTEFPAGGRSIYLGVLEVAIPLR